MVKQSTVLAAVLAQSGLFTIVVSPGTMRNASYATSTFSHNLTYFPAARWIWDGTGTGPSCNMNIILEDVFSIRCLDQTIAVSISADSSCNASLISLSTGSQLSGYMNGSNVSNVDNYSIPTNGLACGTHAG